MSDVMTCPLTTCKKISLRRRPQLDHDTSRPPPRDATTTRRPKNHGGGGASGVGIFLNYPLFQIRRRQVHVVLFVLLELFCAMEIPFATAILQEVADPLEDSVCRNEGQGGANTCSSMGTTTADTTIKEKRVGSLHPSDLPGPVVFTNFTQNYTTILNENGQEIHVAEGRVTQINHYHYNADDKNPHDHERQVEELQTEFSVLLQALSRASVETLLELLHSYQYWDEDPDTVDGMPTYEMFVDNPGLYKAEGGKPRDHDPQFVPQRQALRQQLQGVLQAYLDQVLTPYVRQRYPQACTTHPNRLCTPCYSLIRKYDPNQRMSHATHHDGHAIVTVVVSLSDYNVDYKGGLYVSTGFGQHEFLALNKGDAVVHQSTLLHGVRVYELDHDSNDDVVDESTTNNNTTTTTTNRWSWILWYHDSTTCQDDYGYEWFVECARDGNPLCQQLHANKVGATPGLSQQQAADQVLDYNIQAARGGAGMAAVKVARAYLHQLASSLPFSVEKAVEYFQIAIESHNPDGHYGMAQLLLGQVKLQQQQQQQESSLAHNDFYKDERVRQAVYHLEQAALLGHAFSQYNLGMVHTFGYATGHINGTFAAEWFVASGLPEGNYLCAKQAQAIGNTPRYDWCAQRAVALGFTAPWRPQARQITGSGGAGGVSLNLHWPTAMDGRIPPEL